MLKNTTKWMLAAALLGSTATLPTYAQRWKGNGGMEMGGGGFGDKEEIKDIKSATAKHAVMKGLFTVYQDSTNGELKLMVKKEQFGKEYIYFSYTENGLTDFGLNRGNYRGSSIIEFKLVNNTIEILQKNTNFYFDPTSPLAKASDANISKAILAKEKLIAKNDSTGEYLINGSSIFFEEILSQIKSGGGSPMEFSLGNLKREKTKALKIRSYPENTDFVIEYVYSSAFSNGGPTSAADPRNLSVVFQHSLIEVPKNDFVPRFEDPRIGYFTEKITDMTSTSATPYRDLIHRWNLVKKDPNAALSEPVKPIVYWIENTTPLEFREVIKEAGEKWNLAFEKAGFKNAFQIKVQPDDADWDAGDIRYNVIRWTSSPNPPYNGYGPSFVNPRTGEILGADIMIEFAAMTRRLNEKELFKAMQDQASLFMENSDTHSEENHEEAKCCSASKHLQYNALLGLYAIQQFGGPIPVGEYMKGAVHYLILHEIGHTLGLMHNMKASQLHSPDDIHNKALTSSVGLVGSVMDYPAINLALDPSKQGEYFFSRPGPYDLWAIEFGYSPALSDEKAERERLDKILARSTEKGHTFGNDADDMRSPGKGIDPRVNVRELSSDAVRYSSERLLLVDKVLSDILERYQKENTGQSYHELRNIFSIFSYERSMAISAVSRYIGGVYVERNFQGQSSTVAPFTPVPYEYQKKAMQVLEKQVFAPTALKEPEKVYNYLQMQRRGFDFFDGTEDPKIHSRLMTHQTAPLAHILHPATLQRIVDSQLYGNKYSVNEVLSDLTKAIFSADATTNVNTIRQNLQSFYVQQLIGIAKSETNAYPIQAKSSALASLLEIKKMMNNSTGDELTKAHRKRIQWLIDSALAN